MKTVNLFLALLLSFGLVALAGCPVVDDDDSADDDDVTGDDDDVPDYEGFVDMGNSYIEAGCTIEVSSGDPAGGSGYFDFFTEVDGWANICWVEMWDLTSDYCEGWDPETGDVCGAGTANERPGWDMIAGDNGYDPATGMFYDEWSLSLDYHGEIWPPEDDATLFICENAGNNFELWYCCCDWYDDTFCDCTMFPMDAW